MVLSRIGKSIVIMCAFVGFTVAAAWSIRVGYADCWMRKESIAGAERAIALTPNRSIYYRRLAFLVAENQPNRAMLALEHSVALNPEESLSWIELGLHNEANGDQRLAAQDLLRAAEMDKQYLPRWSLANYYFRQNDTPRFWFWAKKSADMLYDDPLPLFRLCGKVVEDGNLLERLSIQDPAKSSAYLSYLLSIDRLELLGPSLQRVLDAGRTEDTPLLLTLCDQLLRESRVEDALRIWNKLASERKIAFPVKAAASQSLLTNGRFLIEPISGGFDWHLPKADGISLAREDPEGVRLTFSGDEPEHFELLSQYVPVQENGTYELKFLYRTSGIESGTGIHWEIENLSSATKISAGQSLSSEQEVQGKLSFVCPPGRHLIRVVLAYQRNPGTTRIAGFIILRSIELFASS